jgi:hypothetical protein
MTQQEIENLKGKGMVFNSPDPKPFQDALRKTDFYSEMKKKSGEKAWGCSKNTLVTWREG